MTESYFDHNARAPSWEVVEVPPMMVCERELTDAEVEQWRERIARAAADDLDRST